MLLLRKIYSCQLLESSCLGGIVRDMKVLTSSENTLVEVWNLKISRHQMYWDPIIGKNCSTCTFSANLDSFFWIFILYSQTMANRWGKRWKQWQILFFGASESPWKVTAAMKLLLGRKMMTSLDSILKGRDIPLLTKVCLVKVMVFPVVMYGCESWTIKKAEHQRIDAFKLWCWRKLLRVPWTARRSN